VRITGKTRTAPRLIASHCWRCGTSPASTSADIGSERARPETALAFFSK
jgi:hypothetical protein